LREAPACYLDAMFNSAENSSSITERISRLKAQQQLGAAFRTGMLC
jgi:hypothetical protein